MDPRLKTVLEDVNHIDSINNQKRFLKEKFYEDIVIFHNGGKFTVTGSFVAFAKEAASNNIRYIVDDNDIPVDVENVQEFYNKIVDAYAEATENYFKKYNDLIEKSRNIEELLSI